MNIIQERFWSGTPGYISAPERSKWKQSKEFKDTNLLSTKVLNGVGPYRAGVIKELTLELGRYPSWSEWVQKYVPMLSEAEISRGIDGLIKGGLSEEVARRVAIIRLVDEPFVGATREKAAVEFLAESLGTAWVVRPAIEEEDMNLKVDVLCFPFESVTPKVGGIQVKALSFALSPRIGSQRLRMRKDLLATAESLSTAHSLPAVTGVLFYSGSDTRNLSWLWAPASELTEDRVTPLALEMPWISQKMGLYTPEEKASK